MKYFLSLIFSLSCLAGFIPKKFEAELEQVFVTRLKKIKKEPLNIKYQFPKKIRMVTQNTVFVCNKKKAWKYSPPFIKGEKGDLIVGKADKHCFARLFDGLKHGLKSNKVYKVSKDLKKSKVDLIFGKSDLGIKSISFHIKGAIDKKLTFSDVAQMDIQYLNQKKKVAKYIIKNVKTDVKFKGKEFRFEVPENTRVVDSDSN